MAARSAGVETDTSSAPSASLSRSRRRAPTSGMMSSPCAATQAMAICATDTPFASATLRRASTSARLRSRLSPWKRGLDGRGSLWPSCALAPVAADQATRQHAIGGDADAELAASRQDLFLDAARDQRIFDLQVGDRVHGRGAADRLGADLRQADMPDIACLHQIGDRADRILDRHIRIEPRRPVDVDMVDAQPLQRIGAKVLTAAGRASKPIQAADGIAHAAELDADQRLVAAAAGQRLGDQHLVVAHAVEIAGVDQR